jgi:hypothetical protein
MRDSDLFVVPEFFKVGKEGWQFMVWGRDKDSVL